MFKVPSHCSLKPNLHELWSKEGAGVKLGIWLPTINPLKTKVKWASIEACFTPLEFSCFEGYKILISHFFFKKIWFEKYMNIQNFRTTRVPILGLPFESLGEKWHLDVIPVERHIMYYREGSGASSQRLWPSKACVWGCYY